MKHLLIAFIPAFLLTACFSSSSQKEDFLPDSAGNRGEIVVIMENQLWNGPLGDTIQSFLSQNAKGPYLRPEPMFDYHHSDPKNLTHGNKLGRLLLKVHVDYDSTYGETAVIEKENYFAKDQLFIIIKDSDPNRLKRYVETQFTDVMDRLNEFTTLSLEKYYRAHKNNGIALRSKELFGIDIALPSKSALKVETEDFMWVKYDRSHSIIGNQSTGAKGGVFWIQEGIVFWSEPYSDSAMDPSNIMSNRDTVLKHNVPGKLEGSYMATEYDPAYAPTGEVTTFNGNDCVKIKGLWKHAGNPAAAGGGPFVQYSIHHPKTNQIVTVCGYVYAPKFDKREHIRELEAMLNTIDID
ncbi:DUF4837 family protein [Paracrocinitomix mangrovi]|uniref:DUF4837 family protein n=1 Tax=Paracrocinitomix mangrovi TaxID=2862509 RepID=UPI001C8E750C|nr:DUF4837 family protein [Paracrocinitomix mangrovi]UKN00938.1 DUF4837 family protein [Paracrocinitomix mangrovi]